MRESSLKQSSVFNPQAINECESIKLGPYTKKEKLKFDLMPPLLKIYGYATVWTRVQTHKSKVLPYPLWVFFTGIHRT